MDRPRLAICGIFKNEARYILEWIAYHLAIGFDHLVLYDNDSTDGGADLIRRSAVADKVTLIRWPLHPGQLPAYRHFIDIFAPSYDWAAFIDTDEFVLPLDGESLPEMLGRIRHASAVLVHWRIFGPAGREEPGPGLVLETYDLRAPDDLPANRHVKSIVRCADLLDVTQNPHEFRVRGPVCNALAHEVPNLGLQPSPCHASLVINHYYTKSRQDWREKAVRGDAMFTTPSPNYTEEVFDHLSSACNVRDETIKAFLPRVRAILHTGGAVCSSVPDSACPVGNPEDVAAPASAPAGSGVTPSPKPMSSAPAPGWIAVGPDVQVLETGSAMVFRDGSRSSAPWLAALRGPAAGLIDPDFLLDEHGRLREFASDLDAREACEAADASQA